MFSLQGTYHALNIESSFLFKTNKFSFFFDSSEPFLLESNLASFSKRDLKGYYQLTSDKQDMTQMYLHGSLNEETFFIASLRPNTPQLSRVYEGNSKIDTLNEPFPYAFYFKIGATKLDSSMIISISELKYDDHPSKDIFDIGAYLVTDAFIESYILEQTIPIEGEKLNLVENKNESYSVNVFDRDFKTKRNGNIFVKYTKNENNFNIYKSSIFKVESFYTINFFKPNDYVYYYGSLDHVETFRIEGNNFIGPTYKIIYSIEYYKDYPTYENDPLITLVNSTTTEGKTALVYELGSLYKPFVLFNLLVEGTEELINYSFKYQSYAESRTEIKLEYPIIEYSKNGKE